VDLRDPRLEKLRRYQHILDSAFRVPGTNVRFGWDPIVGLVPWAGDLLTAVMAGAIVLQAHRFGVPRVVQLRMLINVGIDLLLGVVPFVGDAADVFWKANAKNMTLLERHAAALKPATGGDWVFVGTALAAIGLMALLPLVLMYLVTNAVIDLGLLSR
jgi:hypothetical protein